MFTVQLKGAELNQKKNVKNVYNSNFGDNLKYIEPLILLIKQKYKNKKSFINHVKCLSIRCITQLFNQSSVISINCEILNQSIILLIKQE